MSQEQLGEIAYNAYCAERNWKSVKGEQLPHWGQQDKSLRDAWIMAAKAVAAAIHNATSMG